MPISATDLDADLLAMQNDFPSTMKWRGQDYPCLAADLNESNRLVEEGFMVDASNALIVRTALFGGGEMPRGNDVVYFGVTGAKQQKYRVAAKGVIYSIDGASLTLFLCHETE
jgi:hypothetical protein